MLRTDIGPQTKFLKDYKAPDFSIGHVALTFEIFEGKTTVRAKTSFVRKNDAAKNLVLDGKDMTLVSVAINGDPLSPNRIAASPETLTVLDVPDNFTLDIITEICPEENTALEGLYASSGNYCTQCEAEGFRKITYYPDRPDVMTKFTTRIEADLARCPVLLSNGNCIERGGLSGGRHYAVWEDPFAKPCYLFALVAGDLEHVHDTFTTSSGRKVDLFIYVNHGNAGKCAHAMESLKRSMKWDEEKYGREYDLDIFNIVAVHDFNMGAMENKSLNIFNSKLILARAETATDADFLAIESVVAHEYFHNWTGNRITCRDWFQLSLKEGLTVFRDQCFSSDMNSEDVSRIEDVEQLRNSQFPEDASPMAHPVRPDNYIEISNFYTPTVYEKGAEVIRMMHTILGPENYRKGTDLYFARHDEQAVTCDDFAQCMQNASGIDLSQFRLWYSQAGTPEITAKGSYDAAAKKFTLTLTQSVPDTPGQTGKKSMHIPFSIGLLDSRGDDMLHEGGTRILHLQEQEQHFTFDHIAEKPVPSLLRGFSAPVRLTSDLTDDDLLFLMAHDSDGFNRWDAGQTCLQRILLRNIKSKTYETPEPLYHAFDKLVSDKSADRALLAKALTLPPETYLAQLMDTVDVDGIHTARKAMMHAIGTKFHDRFIEIYHASAISGSYDLSPESVGKRRLKSAALRFLQAADEPEAVNLAFAQYKTATNMTDKISALAILTDSQQPERQKAFESFYADWKNDPLVLDKWFTLQAVADRQDTVEMVHTLITHPDFTYKNPNRLRALIGSFGMSNQKWFHRPDGAGYKMLADVVITMNALNPSIAARLLTPLRQWRRYDSTRRGLMENELKRILSGKDISNDVYEVVSKSLN